MFCTTVLTMLLITISTFTLQVVENNFANTHAFWSHLHILITLDVLKRLLKREDDRRDDASLFICTTGTNVGQLFGLGHIDYQVYLMHMLAYHLTCIDRILWIDEELAPVLQVVDSISKCRARLPCNE